MPYPAGIIMQSFYPYDDSSNPKYIELLQGNQISTKKSLNIICLFSFFFIDVVILVLLFCCML